MPNASDDAAELERDAQGIRAQLRRQMRRLLDPHAVATRLFRTANGQLRDDAIAWLEWLERRSFITVPTYDPDARAHAFNEGRRSLALEIINGLRLDTRRLAAIHAQLKEVDDE